MNVYGGCPMPPRTQSLRGAQGQIFYAEFDGQRPKRVLVKIIGA